MVGYLQVSTGKVFGLNCDLHYASGIVRKINAMRRIATRQKSEQGAEDGVCDPLDGVHDVYREDMIVRRETYEHDEEGCKKVLDQCDIGKACDDIARKLRKKVEK